MTLDQNWSICKKIWIRWRWHRSKTKVHSSVSESKHFYILGSYFHLFFISVKICFFKSFIFWDFSVSFTLEKADFFLNNYFRHQKNRSINMKSIDNLQIESRILLKSYNWQTTGEWRHGSLQKVFPSLSMQSEEHDLQKWSLWQKCFIKLISANFLLQVRLFQVSALHVTNVQTTQVGYTTALHTLHRALRFSALLMWSRSPSAWTLAGEMTCELLLLESFHLSLCQNVGKIIAIIILSSDHKSQLIFILWRTFRSLRKLSSQERFLVH